MEGLLRKKLLEGRVQLAWLDKGLACHQGALREVWPALLALAQRLARCREAPLAGAGAHLYKLLFVHFEQSCSRWAAVGQERGWWDGPTLVVHL